MKIGYARVSTRDQKADLQVDALKQAGCERIYQDIASGAKSARPELDKLLANVRPGDAVVIWKLDRLGRSLKHLVELVGELAERKVGLQSLNDPIDTTHAQGRLVFNLFASLARMSPFLPLIGGGHTRFQPVFVGDVAQAIARAVDGEARAGTTYELGGPEVRTFREILEYILKTTERRRLLVPLPFLLAKLQASLMQFMPTPLLTPDQVELLRTDNVVSQEAMTQQRTLQGLGITTPEPIEAIVPSYLWRFRKTGQFRAQPTQ